MKAALERLGFAPCYHMVEVPRRGHGPFWREAMRRKARGEPVDWDAAFAGYRATVDFPAANFWAELAEAYPKAKVLLTVRDPNRWYDSACRAFGSVLTVDISTAGGYLASKAMGLLLPRVWGGDLGDAGDAGGLGRHLRRQPRGIGSAPRRVRGARTRGQGARTAGASAGLRGGGGLGASVCLPGRRGAAGGNVPPPQRGRAVPQADAPSDALRARPQPGQGRCRRGRRSSRSVGPRAQTPAPYLKLQSIHPTSQKRNSRKFANTEFSEVRVASLQHR